MKKIYIVLIKAHTGLGRFARILGGYPYTHIAVSLDKSLTDFITYSRRKHYLTMDAGFMHEYRDYYAFGEHKKVRVKVFCLPVEDDKYKKVTEFIRNCENDPKGLFNLFSMVTMSFIHGIPIRHAHNCMSFTAGVIEASGAVHMDKPYYKYDIKEIDSLLTDYLYFEGFLKRKSSPGYDEYMKKYGISEKISSGFTTITGLFKAIIKN